MLLVDHMRRTVALNCSLKDIRNTYNRYMIYIYIMYMKIALFNSLVWGLLRLTPMTTFAASGELSLIYGIAFGVSFTSS